MLRFLDHYFYILMFLCAFACCILISAKRKDKFGYSTARAMVITVICALSGCVGAKLMFILENPGLKLKLNGLSFFGSVFLVPIVMWLAAKGMKRKYLEVMDFIALYIPLTLAFLRFGCAHNGCCGTDLSVSGPMGFVMPIQMIEAVLDLCMVYFLRSLEQEEQKEGITYPRFMVLYGILRLVTEIYRVEPRNAAGMSNGQLYSMICIVLGGIIIYHLEHNGKIAKVRRRTSVSKNRKKK